MLTLPPPHPKQISPFGSVTLPPFVVYYTVDLLFKEKSYNISIMLSNYDIISINREHFSTNSYYKFGKLFLWRFISRYCSKFGEERPCPSPPPPPPPPPKSGYTPNRYCIMISFHAPLCNHNSEARLHHVQHVLHFSIFTSRNLSVVNLPKVSFQHG